MPAESDRGVVTILMPVRDAALTLPACLESVRAQHGVGWRLLAIDDHSRDGSRRILHEAMRSDSRIRVLSNPGRGIVSALNAGLAATRSEFVARMDADDLMTPDRLAAQHAHMAADTGLAVLGCRVRQFPAATEGARHYLEWQNRCCTPADIDAEIYVEAPFAHPSVMFRRAAVVAAGGYRDGDFPEDYELWLRLHARGVRMAKLARTLVYWRDGPQRASRRDPRYRREAFDRLRAQYLERDARFRKHRERFVIWGAGRRTRRRCEHLLQRGYRPRAWIDIDPRKIGNRIDGAWVRAPHWLEDNTAFVLGYVASHGAREDIARWLESRGRQRGRCYLMVG